MVNLIKAIIQVFDVPEPIINLDHFVIDEDGNETCIIVQDVESKADNNVTNADHGNSLTKEDLII